MNHNLVWDDHLVENPLTENCGLIARTAVLCKKTVLGDLKTSGSERKTEFSSSGTMLRSTIAFCPSKT